MLRFVGHDSFSGVCKILLTPSFVTVKLKSSFKMRLIYQCSLDCIRQSANRTRQIAACKRTLSILIGHIDLRFKSTEAVNTMLCITETYKLKVYNYGRIVKFKIHIQQLLISMCVIVPSCLECLECENVNIILRYASVLACLRALNALNAKM